MQDKNLLALFGLKYNPFLPNIPVDSLWRHPDLDSFMFRIENMVMDGGFALVCGEAGLGKSKNLQMVAHRLGRVEDVTIGVMERPQSSLSDFYREMGALFGVTLTPANRYGGFKALRQRWQEHIKKTLFRPVLLIDEAQEMAPYCLNELRLLANAHFDSQCLMTIVLCGDMRLPERFRASELVSLGSRIRHRLLLEPYNKEVLRNYLEHALHEAGAAHLMSQSLISTLIDHASGNLRVLNTMAAELLAAGAQRELTQLDDKLFLETFARQPRKVRAS